MNEKEKVECQESLASPPQSSQSSPVKQKPPAVSKKPHISLLPPFRPQPLNEQVPSHKETTRLSQTADQVDAPQRLINEEQDHVKSEQQEEEVESSAESSETSAPSQNESQSCDSASQETGLSNGLCTNGEADEEEEEGDGTSSTTGSISSKEDDTGESD